MMNVGDFARALVALWLTEMLWLAWLVRDLWLPQLQRRLSMK